MRLGARRQREQDGLATKRAQLARPEAEQRSSVGVEGERGGPGGAGGAEGGFVDSGRLTVVALPEAGTIEVVIISSPGNETNATDGGGDDGSANVTISIQDLGLGLSGDVKVRDVWAKKDLASVSATGTFTTSVPHHGSVFLIFMPPATKWPQPYELAPWMKAPVPPTPPAATPLPASRMNGEGQSKQ